MELNVLGAVAGIDLRRPALKLPGLGRLGLPLQAAPMRQGVARIAAPAERGVRLRAGGGRTPVWLASDRSKSICGTRRNTASVFCFF